MAEGKSVKKPLFIVLITVIIIFAIIVFSSSITIIPEGYVGVKYQLGRIVKDDLSSGMQFVIPFIQNVSKIDVREQVYDVETTAYTNDTQTVECLKIKLNYLYDRSSLSDIIRNIGINNVETKLIVPQIQSIVKNEIGQFRAEELIQNRSTVQENIEKKLKEKLAPQGIIVSSFAIENIDFESGFEEAVRAKVVAEQEALKMQNKTKEKEELAKQAVIEAQAKADSAKIEAEAEAYAIELVQKQLSTSPEYIELEKIKKWDGKLPTAMGETINPFVSLGE